MYLHRHSVLRNEMSEYGMFLSQFVSFQPGDLSYLKIRPIHIAIDEGTFSLSNTGEEGIRVQVVQTEAFIEFSCNCDEHRPQLCEHQLAVINAIARREELSIFFQKPKRIAKLSKLAAEYGLVPDDKIEEQFWITLNEREVQFTPRVPGLISVSKDRLTSWERELSLLNSAAIVSAEVTKKYCVVFRRHKFYQQLQIGLYEEHLTKQGKLKNPLVEVAPLALIWQKETAVPVAFLSAIAHCQQLKETALQEADLVALQTLLEQRQHYDFYLHQEELSEQVTATSLTKMTFLPFTGQLVIEIKQKATLHEVSLKIEIDRQRYSLADVTVKFDCLVGVENRYYLLPSLQLYTILQFFSKQSSPLRVHTNKFDVFQSAVLDKMQDYARIEYPAIQSKAQNSNKPPQAETDQLLYLSDNGTYVQITPVVRYGDIEIPVRSKRLIYDKDEKGRPFYMARNESLEERFLQVIVRVHPDLLEQLSNSLPYFYLPKTLFLDENWFLQVFEDWREANIAILGFNTLEGNKVAPFKGKVQVLVNSGINWFNATIQVRFGKKKATLKSLQSAVVNKRKYVTLDDGTVGLLPTEWLARFKQYFEVGEVTNEDTLMIPWVNFAVVDQLFDQEMFEIEAYKKLKAFQQQLASETQPTEWHLSPLFNGTLRSYQVAGAQWLTKLDRLNFGGCLADDMGLGKSAQMIALLLSNYSPAVKKTNLIVVPTSLVYNWVDECKKFAPCLQVATYTGTARKQLLPKLLTYDVVLVTYQIVVSDCNYLKKLPFDRIILDESHYIKNPETQRYKAVSLLQARNRFVMTGTPIENNTFDLYSQLSFACPGLLGSKRSFKALFSTPIDQFKDTDRAKELQQKISPFILRRTKKEVAQELPDKTELTIYCEMSAWQRKIYDAYEKEFREYIDATSGEELKQASMHVLKGLTRLRQICNSPSLVEDIQVPEGEQSSKLTVLLDKIKEVSVQHKVLVFSQFVSMLELVKTELEKEHISYSVLTGASRNRNKIIADFKDDEQKRVFLISLKAGGTGLNLTEAEYVFIIDPWWNPAVEAQAIDRAHRIGQTKKVIAVRLICPNTVEEKISILQTTKNELASQLIVEGNQFPVLQKESLLSLIGG